MLVNNLSQIPITYNRQQKDKFQASYVNLNNRNAKDVFVSSTPKQVSFGGFFDFLKPQKHETDEEKFEKILQNVSDLREDFSNHWFAYNSYIKKMKKEVATIEPDKQQALIEYIMNKIIDTTSVDDDYFNLASIIRPMFGLSAENIIPYTKFENAAKNVGYSSFSSFKYEDTFTKETKAIKINRVLKDAQPFDLKSFEEIYDKINHIEMRFSIMNYNKESVKFVLNNLPDIFYTEDNAEDYKKLLNKIDRTIRSEADWGVQDEFGNNLAYRAVLSENPLLVDFAKKKKVDFNAPNQAGECAFDLIDKLNESSRIKRSNNKVEELTSKVQQTEMSKNNNTHSEKIELDNLRKELSDLGFNYALSYNKAETEAIFKKFIELIQSPQYKPAKLSDSLNQNGDKNFRLEYIINSLPDRFIPYIKLETFGEGEDKIHEHIRINSYSVEDDELILEAALENPERYLDKVFDYYKYQCNMNANDFLTFLYEQLTPSGTSTYSYEEESNDLIYNFLRLLKDNKKITGDEKISISNQKDLEKERITLAEALFLDKDTTKVFPAAQVWYISSKNAEETGNSQTLDRVTEKIARYNNRAFVNTVKNVRENYEVNSYLQDAINKSIVKKIGSAKHDDIPELQNLLIEIDICKPDFVEFAVNKSRKDLDWIDNYTTTLNQVAKNSDEDYKKVLNFYKNYFQSGGKINFDKIKDYETVKLLQDAGLTADSTDLSGKFFSISTAKLWGPNGEKPFPVDGDFVKKLLGDEYLLPSQNVSKFRNYLDNFDTFEKVIKEYSELYDVITDKDCGYIPFLDNNLYLATKMRVLKDFNGVIDADGFKNYLNSLEKEEGKNSYDTKSLNLLNLHFAALDAKEQEKVIDLIAPYGIKNFSIKRKARDAAAKAGLERQFRPYPDLKDGIGTMEQFWILFSNPKHAPNLLPDQCFNIAVNDDNETIIDIMIGLNCEKDEDKKYKSEMLEDLEKYSDKIDWNHCDKYGNNYVIKAIMAEDFQTLKFLLDNKEVDLAMNNQFGQNAMELAQKSQNPKIRELFENVKINSTELLELVKLGSASGIELLLQNKYIDVNSRDDEGYTPWLYAAKSGNVAVAEVLAKHPELDFNAVNDDGDNFAIIAAKSRNLNFIKEVFPKLKPEQLNLNYINDKNSETIYTVLAFSNNRGDVPIFQTILKHKDANPNISSDKVPPVAFQLVLRNEKWLFEILAKSGKLDLNVKYGDQTLTEYINKQMFGYIMINNAMERRKEYLQILSDGEDIRNIEKVKHFVNENGVMSLKNIMEFLDYPNISKVITCKLSDSEERIGHLLCDIETTPQNFMQILGAAKKILELDRNSFNYRDNFNQTAIEKALHAENEILFEYIAQNSLLTSFDIEKLKNIAKNINNPKIDRIIAKLKPEGGSNDNQ